MDILKDPLVNGCAYALATAGTIVAQVQDLHVLEYVCKPLMMAILGSWFYFNSRRAGDRFTLMVQLALFFSLGGDVALMFDHRDAFLFIIGLAAFLVAHLCYTIAFAMNVFETNGTDGAWVATGFSILLFLFGVLFMLEVINSPNVEDTLKPPMAVYALAITAMGIFAAFRFRKTFDRSFWLVFGGAVLFIVSDALLANRKFNLRPFELGSVWIITCYAAGQFMIAAGCMLHVFDPETIRRKQALS